MSDKGHSEDYFGEERDFWWNKDFFELMAKRWGLNKYSSLLDIGSGQCHWSKLFPDYLKSPAKITALDFDLKWAKESDSIKEYFSKRNAEITFIQGDAHQLPFPNNSFDIVTCQTVLIHLNDPFKAIQEMKRVLKKGGILICAEMNNLAGALVRNNLMETDTLEDTFNRIKYQLIYEKGKKKLGEGDNSIGDLVPGMFAKAGLAQIKVYLSDKASPMVPPYNSQEEKAITDTLEQWTKDNQGDLDYEQALKYFKAVSDNEKNMEFFHNQYTKNKSDMEKQLESMKNKEFTTGGAYVMYLISGLKEV